MKIETSYESSWRQFWATDRDTYDGDPHDPCGRGKTAEEAINDLVEQLVENAYAAGLKDGKVAA